ncbi:MAG TPA: porin family protein [Steroidobacteraceae bacterium]|nr:porin family protein [Steroidobacteraceae bacterium]
MKSPIKSASIMAALAALLMSSAVTAQGVYLGGSALQSRFDSDEFDVEDVDEEDTGWKAFVGVRPSEHFAIEGGFTQFGQAEAPSVAVGGPFESKAEALSLFGVGILPAGPVDLFAKAGVARIKAEGNVGAVLFEDKATEFAYGVGAQFNMGRLGIRAEYEKFDTDVIGDLDVISLGVVFSFGPSM